MIRAFGKKNYLRNTTVDYSDEMRIKKKNIFENVKDTTGS